MSILIDELVKLTNCNKQYFEGWYVAKPYESTGFLAFLRRARDAWRVLTGRSRAYHFYQDELEEQPLINRKKN